MNQEACEIETHFQQKNIRTELKIMLRKMKRTLSLVLALIMICSAMGVMTFATETDSGQVDNYRLVEKFFTRDYTIWDKSENDITTTFYNEMTPYYEAGNFGVISEYISQNVGYAEYFDVTEYTPPPYSRAYAEKYIEWGFVDEKLPTTATDFNGNPAHHNTIEIESSMWFGYDDEERVIITAGAPYVSYMNLIQTFGGNEPTYSVSNSTYSISPNEQDITFSFTVDITAPTENPYMESYGLVWRYIKTYTRSSSCG